MRGRHLGVDRADVPVRRLAERVDLQHGAVTLDEGVVERQQVRRGDRGHLNWGLGFGL